MIRLHNIRGTPWRPLILDLRGLHIDGGGTTVPLTISDCSWLDIWGGNYFHSLKNCIWVYGCESVRLREMCAWDAEPTGNWKSILITDSRHCSIVDCGTWGTGRKQIDLSYGGNDTLVSRCWTRWEGSEAPGPKNNFAIAYNSRRNRFEHSIGMCANLPADPHDYYGVFAADRMDDGLSADTSVADCLAMSPHDVRAFNPTTVQGIEFARCLDACGGKMPDPDGVARLRAAWSDSPLLPRLRTLAGVDVLAELDTLARTIPSPHSQPVAN